MPHRSDDDAVSGSHHLGEQLSDMERWNDYKYRGLQGPRRNWVTDLVDLTSQRWRLCERIHVFLVDQLQLASSVHRSLRFPLRGVLGILCNELAKLGWDRLVQDSTLLFSGTGDISRSLHRRMRHLSLRREQLGSYLIPNGVGNSPNVVAYMPIPCEGSRRLSGGCACS